MIHSRQEIEEIIWDKTHHLPHPYREQVESDMYADWLNEMSIGDHCHVVLWTDIKPCTVIKRTKSTITIRYDTAVLDPTWKPEFDIGGFCAHCSNNDEQRWNISEDVNGVVEVFRKHKNGMWYNLSDCRLYPEWYCFYDYNF